MISGGKVCTIIPVLHHTRQHDGKLLEVLHRIQFTVHNFTTCSETCVDG